MRRTTRAGGFCDENKSLLLNVHNHHLKWYESIISHACLVGDHMRFLCVVGTRPEAIKLAPVILELAQHANVTTICSGQHISLAKEPLEWFGIKPDDEIVIGSQFRTLAMLTGALISPMERMIEKHRPDIIVTQGDTTTVLVTALTSFYLGIPFAHVEAGLRTGNLRAPFPEEFNRVAADRAARWHFCPTKRAAANLHAEGVESSRVFVTGNTGIDSLRLTLERTNTPDDHNRRLRRILLTVHRRENQGDKMKAICQAVREIVHAFKDVEFVIPVHPAPTVRRILEQLLSGHNRIQLLPPLPYQNLVSEMARCYLILTDSGGIQEEAPYLKKPVLVLRDVTERPETVDLGVAQLIGTEPANVTGAVRQLLTDATSYSRMASGATPYGDGYAAQRIASALGVVKSSSRGLRKKLEYQ
jgi:UDP-N-acetylglucosamine 2-epimerase (non-hydrolysing)